MERKSQFMLKVLLNKFEKQGSKHLFKPLSAKTLAELKETETTLDDPRSCFENQEELLAKTHYSWLLPIVEESPDPLKPLLIAALPDAQSAKIQKKINLSTPKKLLTPLAKHFFSYQIYQKIKPIHILSAKCLRQTPLTALLKMSKEQLVEVIDLLGIYDLTEVMRFTIDKELVSKIHLALTPKQKLFLRQTLHQKEKLLSTPLDLKQWNGEGKSLTIMLHRRGLVRLSKALCGEEPDMVWHLSHLLDKGRGTLLKSHYSANPMPAITEAPITKALEQQVLNILNFLNVKE